MSSASNWIAELFGRELATSEVAMFSMVPVFAAAFIAEWVHARLRSGTWSVGKGERFDLRETSANILLGGGYLVSGAIMNALFLSAVLAVFWEQRLFTIPLNLGTIVIAFFAQELCYYVYHRAAHRIRWFWCQHVSHHTGLVMNMSTAARQSILNGVIGVWIFFVPAVLIGFPPELIFGLLVANLAFQWFVHTESISKLHPWIEWWINTPSNHRVHHGRNKQYIDKNYGGVIMLYDHLFGSYQPEVEQPEYGIVTQIDSHNWFVLNLHELVDMTRDIMAPGPLAERLRHLWKPPEWQREGHAPVHTWKIVPARPSEESR